MPEQITPGAAGQGAEHAPADGGDKGTFDYERAYGEIRPAYTQATQEAAQYRERLSEYDALFEALHSSDPALQAQALDALGLEPAEAGSPEPGRQQDDDDWSDPLEDEVKSLREQLDEVRTAREQEAAEREEQDIIDLQNDYIGEAIGLIEESLSVEGKPFKFSEQEEEVLGNLAIATPGEDGLPDVRTAYTQLFGPQGLIESRLSRRIDTKEGAAQAPLGTTIPADQKPRTAQDRIAWADERWAQLQRQA